MTKIQESEFENTSNEVAFRRGYAQNENRNFQIKDIIIILLFLGCIAAIYTNINERLVKVELKGEIISQQLIEIKADTSKVITKLDETMRTLQNQVRDMEVMMMNNKSGRSQP